MIPSAMGRVTKGFQHEAHTLGLSVTEQQFQMLQK